MVSALKIDLIYKIVHVVNLLKNITQQIHTFHESRGRYETFRIKSAFDHMLLSVKHPMHSPHDKQHFKDNQILLFLCHRTTKVKYFALFKSYDKT
jgi:hypothetical protein